MQLVAARRHATRRVAPSRAAVGALGIWIALFAVSVVWGQLLLADGARLFIHAPPLYGHLAWEVGPGAIVTVAVAAVIVFAAPTLARTLSWRGLLGTTAVAAAAWPLALSLISGPGSITHPLTSSHEYLTVVPSIESAGTFVSTFIERIDSFATHVSGHPPGFPLILFGLDRVGLGGPGPATALVVAVAATTPVAVLIAVRAVAGERLARSAAPFLVIAPAAIWIVTSADALFMGVGAWAVTLTVIAILDERPARSAALALGGGLLFGVVCFLSFGLVLLGTIPLAVAIWRRRARALLVAAAGALGVFAAFAAAGYWWLDGLAAARGQYYDGVASVRPFGYFVVANMAAFAIATGPATAAGLGRLGRGPLWVLVAGGAAAVAVADLSAMSKAEVERIWLPFAPWVMLAAAMLPEDIARRRRWLAAQAVAAIGLEAFLVTAW